MHGALNTLGATGFGHLNESPAPAPAVAVPRDATSGKGVPLTQAEWNAVFGAAGIANKTVNQSWGLQDSTGNPAATIGTALTAAPNGTSWAYQQTITGWTRKAMVNDVSVARAIGLAAGTGPNAGTQSVLWFCYCDITNATGATRPVMAGGNAATNRVKLNIVVTTGVMQVDCCAVTASGSSDHASGGVRPFVLKYDRTNSVVTVYSDLEKVAGTYNAAVTDTGGKGYPANATIGSVRGSYLIGAAFAGANAEWTDAEVKAVLTAGLGWTVGW